MKPLFLLLCGLLAAAGARGGELALPAGTETDGWTLAEGREFPGARGIFAREPGILRLDADFSGGGDYVGLGRKVRCEAEALVFEVKTSARYIHARLTGDDGQTFQLGARLSGNPDEWQHAVFPVGAGKTFWGGLRDGKWRAPLTGIVLLVRKPYLDGGKGTVLFRNVSLRLKPGAPRFSAVGDDPAGNFVTAGSRSPIFFRLPDTTLSPDPGELRYRITGYSGEPVAEGVASWNPETRRAAVPAPAATGYYEIDCPGLGIASASFVVDRRPPVPADPFFCIDAFFTSWGPPTQTPDEMKRHMRILRDNGIDWSRDRLHLAEISPEKGTVELKGRAEMYRRFGAGAGLSYLETFHDTPAWNRFPQTPRTSDRCLPGTNPFPRDLLAAGGLMVEIARRCRESSRAFESWNEPDNVFGHTLPPEYFASTLKMLSTSLGLAGIPAPVVGGDFANPLRGDNYYRLCLKNGIAEVSDAISFHNYTGVADLTDIVGSMRDDERMVAPARAGIPYWITECGAKWKRGPARPDPAEAVRCAALLVGKAVEARALGVEKFFVFSYKYRFELDFNTGIVDSHYRPLRQMAAYFHLVRELGGREYIGDLKGVGADRVRVFSDGTTAVAAVYSESAKPVRLPGGLAFTAVRGIDGRKLVVENGLLPLADGVAYLEFPLAAVRGHLDAKTRAMELYRMAKEFGREPRAVKPLVIQSMQEVPVPYTNRGYLLPGRDPLRLELMLNNFSGKAVDFEPRLELPPGIASPDFDPRRLSIGPRERRPFAFTLEFDRGLAPAVYHHVVLSDRRGNAAPAAYSMQVAAGGVRRTVTPEFSGWIPIARWLPWTNGPVRADIGAKFRIRWTPEALFLTVRVEDPTPYCDYPPEQAWQGDSLQAAVQGREPGGERIPAEFTEYLLAYRDGAPLLHCFFKQFPGQAEPGFSVRPEQGGMVYELTVPASVFGVKALAKGQTHGLSLLVNSNGGIGRNGYLTWGDGIGAGKFPAMFNILELK